MAPGARSKFGAPIFEPEIFRKQMYCIEGSTCDIIETFRRPGNCVPFPPSLRPWLKRQLSVRFACVHASVSFSFRLVFGKLFLLKHLAVRIEQR